MSLIASPQPRALLSLVFVAGLASLSPTACTTADEHSARAAWIQNQLINDNFPMLARNPDGVAGKFTKMRRGLYEFFRGSTSLFYEDLSNGPLELATTDFGSAESSLVSLVGDPHPENIGTYLNNVGELAIDFNDFDASHVGPFHQDVRRLSLGFYILARAASYSNLSEEDWHSAGEQVTRGYVDGVLTMASDGPGPVVRVDGSEGEIFEELIDDAFKDGGKKKKLNRYAPVDGELRVMTFGEYGPPLDGGYELHTLHPLSATDEAFVRELFEDYRQNLALPFWADDLGEVVSIGQRLGAGVNSYALPRYYVHTEGPSEDPDDDLIIEVREVWDFPRVLGQPILPPRQYASNGERIIDLQRRGQESAGNDQFLGWADRAGRSFKMRNLTGYQRSIDVGDIEERLQDRRWGAEDLDDLAYWAGGILARTHCSVELTTGARADQAIQAVLAGRSEDFVRETRDFVSIYGPQVVEDFRLFQLLYEQEGPLLGFRGLP